MINPDLPAIKINNIYHGNVLTLSITSTHKIHYSVEYWMLVAYYG